MKKRIFKAHTLGIATALITITSFISYAIGLVRDRIIAIHFGTSTATDIYNASFLIPDILFNLFIAGALAAAFLPIYSESLSSNKEEAKELADTMLTGAILVMSSLAILAFFFMKPIIGFIFPTATLSMQHDIVNMTRIMLPSALFFAISNTLGNILMSHKHFFSYAVSPILYNLGIILGVIFFQDTYGIYSAVIGVLVGAFLHAIIRIMDIYSTEYRYKPKLKFKNPKFIKILKLMLPKSISLLAWQINLYIFAVVGLKIVEGGLAAFNFARNIQSFAVSLFGISFATAVFPYLTHSINDNNKIKYTKDIQNTIQRIIFFTLPSAIGIMALSRELVELILSGGVFDEKSINLTSGILLFFAISIPFESLAHILSRSFYALKNTVTPTIIHIFSMIVIALLTIYVAPKYGIEWFSIAFSIGFSIYTVLLILNLKKHLEDFSIREFSISLAKTCLATTIMAIVIFMSKYVQIEGLSIKIIQAIRIVLGAGTFFIVAILIKSKEISSVNYLIKKILKKPV